MQVQVFKKIGVKTAPKQICNTMNQNVILRIISILFSIFIIFQEIEAVENKAISAAGGIRGKVVDADSKTPIEFSNVAAFIPGQKDPVAIETSSADGSFFLRLNKGSYILKFSFVGYATKTDSVEVTGFRPIEMGEVNLSLASSEIEAVVVKGEKSLYENKIDRKVFNVDKSIVSQSGTAVDVLQQVPSVSVDQDGVVSLRGSENVNILVNGRPTLIDKSVLLQQIQANSIEKIEVITNPSVKYESEGNSGIINIVLKQGTAQGINGTAALNVGTNDNKNEINKYNGSINLNYNPGKYNLFGGYTYRQDNMYFKGNSRRYLFNDTSKFTDNYGDRMRESNSFRLGLDYFFNKSLSVGVNGSIGFGKDIGNDITNGNNFNNLNNSFLRWYKNEDEKETNSSMEFAAYLTKKFEKDGHELKIDYSTGSGEEDDDIITGHDTTYIAYATNTYYKTEKKVESSKRGNQIISTDYTLPLNDKIKLELGGKLNIRNNQDELLTNNVMSKAGVPDSITPRDPRNSYFYKYHEDITSLYSTFSFEIGNFSAMTGIKTEFANYDFDIVQLDTTINNYFFSFIPSLHMVEKLNEKNEINLSYSRRINRPRGRDLSPVMDYSNPDIIFSGNPNLKPEYTNSFELGYTYKEEKFTLQPTLFYRLVQDRYVRYRAVNPNTKIDTIKVDNIPFSNSYGADLAITLQPFRFWNINISGSVYQYVIEATQSNPEIKKFSYNGKIMSNTILPKGFAIQLSANYRSPFVTTQGESDPFYIFNLGVKKDLFKGKLTATLNYNDIFNTMKFGMHSRTSIDIGEMSRKRESSVIFFGLTYKFGKAPKNNKKQQQRENRTEESMGDEMMF